MDINIPTNKAEMDELRKSLRQEIMEDDLDLVNGGNDDLKGKIRVPWDCPFCGAHIMLSSAKDAAKHMTKCPNNPYK